MRHEEMARHFRTLAGPSHPGQRGLRGDLPHLHRPRRQCRSVRRIVVLSMHRELRLLFEQGRESRVQPLLAFQDRRMRVRYVPPRPASGPVAAPRRRRDQVLHRTCLPPRRAAGVLSPCVWVGAAPARAGVLRGRACARRRRRRGPRQALQLDHLNRVPPGRARAVRAGECNAAAVCAARTHCSFPTTFHGDFPMMILLASIGAALLSANALSSASTPSGSCCAGACTCSEGCECCSGGTCTCGQECPCPCCEDGCCAGSCGGTE